MSQLADFVELPVTAVRLLIPAAMPRRRLFRKPVYVFQEYLNQHGRNLGSFDADGLYIVIVLLYLRQYYGINLLDGNKGLAIMAQTLSKYQGSFFAFFTNEDRVHSEAVRTVKFEAGKLRQFCEEQGFEYDRYGNISTLQLAASKIADLLAHMKDDHVVLVSVG